MYENMSDEQLQQQISWMQVELERRRLSDSRQAFEPNTECPNCETECDTRRDECQNHGPINPECDHDYKCTYDGMDGERYRCTKCGDSYFLDYDEMR